MRGLAGDGELGGAGGCGARAEGLVGAEGLFYRGEKSMGTELPAPLAATASTRLQC